MQSTMPRSLAWSWNACVRQLRAQRLRVWRLYGGGADTIRLTTLVFFTISYFHFKILCKLSLALTVIIVLVSLNVFIVALMTNNGLTSGIPTECRKCISVSLCLFNKKLNFNYFIHFNSLLGITLAEYLKASKLEASCRCGRSILPIYLYLIRHSRCSLNPRIAS